MFSLKLENVKYHKMEGFAESYFSIVIERYQKNSSILIRETITLQRYLRNWLVNFGKLQVEKNVSHVLKLKI